LEALRHEDSCQTLDELAESLGVNHTTVSKRLKVLGMIQKQGHCVPYEADLKPRGVSSYVNNCFNGRKGKVLHRIVTGDEKWIHYYNTKHRTSWRKSGHTSTLLAKPIIHDSKLLLCIWWDQLGVVYYELLKPNESIMGDRY